MEWVHRTVAMLSHQSWPARHAFNRARQMCSRAPKASSGPAQNHSPDALLQVGTLPVQAKLIRGAQHLDRRHHRQACQVARLQAGWRCELDAA